MKYKNFLKMMAVFSLSVFLILPLAALANAKTTPPAASKQDRRFLEIVIRYGGLGIKYIGDCGDVLEQQPPSGQRLRQCLTISEQLRDQFNEFLESSDALVRKIKNAGKWTNELDEKFNNEAARNGVDAETIRLVKQAGGFRAFYEKSITQLKASRGEFDREVKELEAAIRKNASTQNQSFQKVSFEPVAERRGSKLKAVLKVAKAIADGLTYLCTFTKFCD